MASAADLLAEMDGDAKTSGNPLDALLTEVENEDTTPSWTPEEPASVAGKIVKITATKSDYHDRPVPVWTLEQDGGEQIRVAGFRSVLERDMNESDAEVGDLAAVKYFGKVLKKNAKPGSKNSQDYYQKYRVITKRG